MEENGETIFTENVIKSNLLDILLASKSVSQRERERERVCVCGCAHAHVCMCLYVFMLRSWIPRT